MSVDLRRYGRQIRLADVGEAGQAKLCAAEVVLSGQGFARIVEECYVRTAGMTIIESRGAGTLPRADVVSLGIRHEAARDVAEGAWLALEAMRAALGIAGAS